VQGKKPERRQQERDTDLGTSLERHMRFAFLKNVVISGSRNGAMYCALEWWNEKPIDAQHSVS
jgi:hypothetical protein